MLVNQTKKNFFFNSASLVINVIIGVLYTPFLVQNLGIIAYGIIPLALIINQYIGVVTDSLIASITRFYSVALQQNNYSDASKYLSNSFISIGSLVLVISPILFYGIFNINNLFNIPDDLVHAARLLFLFTIISFVLSLFSSLFNISLYALNRLDLLNIVNISRTLSKIFLVVLFLKFIEADVIYIGIANLISEIFIISLSIYYFKKNTGSYIRISAKYYEAHALISLISMSIWILVHQIGDAGLYRIDNILVNKFWGIKHSAILGAFSELSYYVRISVSVFSSLFGPLILLAYAKGDHSEVENITLKNSLIIGFGTSIIVGLLIGFAKPFINLWLGEEFALYSNWLILKLIVIPFFTASGLFHYVYRAWNQIAFPAIATLILGLINFIIVYLLCSLSFGDEYFILIILCVIVFFGIFQSYALNAYTIIKIYPHIGKKIFFIIFFKILTTTLFAIGIATAINNLFIIKTISQLAFGFFSSALFTIFMSYFLILSREEKVYMLVQTSKFFRLKK